MRSTMSEANQENAEPSNPTVAFERRDVSVRGLVWFVIGLTGLIMTTILVVFGLYSRLAAERTLQTRSKFPVAESARQAARKADPAGPLPPSPRLEGVAPLPPGQQSGRMIPPEQPEQHDVGRIRPGAPKILYDSQEAELDSWRWADADHTAARIPIAEAISRLAAKPGDVLKARPGNKPPTDQPRETNSGRTAQGGPP